VVDDDPSVRKALIRTMRAEGFLVHSASDGLEALTLLAHVATVDVVVSDLRMPRMDGRTLAAELGLRYPHIPMLFISGFDPEVGDGNLPGPVLPKPFRPDALLESVRGVLTRKGIISTDSSGGVH
jgi:CheY-like chemotaxis protein